MSQIRQETTPGPISNLFKFSVKCIMNCTMKLQNNKLRAHQINQLKQTLTVKLDFLSNRYRIDWWNEWITLLT